MPGGHRSRTRSLLSQIRCPVRIHQHDPVVADAGCLAPPVMDRADRQCHLRGHLVMGLPDAQPRPSAGCCGRRGIRDDLLLAVAQQQQQQRLANGDVTGSIRRQSEVADSQACHFNPDPGMHLSDCRSGMEYHVRLQSLERLAAESEESCGFYGQAVRTWYYWLPANLGELCLACGLPVLLSAACTWAKFGFRGIRNQEGTPPVPGEPINATAGQAFVMATMITWALLWLSGKNMGEAMRLWNFLTPWFAIAAAVNIPPASLERIRDGFRNARRTEPMIRLLFLQLLVATLIVATVNGFSF